MRLRELALLGLLCAGACFAGSPAASAIRGKLMQQDGKPALVMSDHQIARLDGDDPTRGILNDKRLAGADLEATGHVAISGLFMVDPIHTKALHAYKDSK